MAITVGLLAESGQGKTTSVVINPDGKCFYLQDGHPNKAESYEGMKPELTVIINADRKMLPFPMDNKWILNRNYFRESECKKIRETLHKISASKKPYSVFIDTINGIMLDKEMDDIKKGGYDKWKDLSQEIYELINFCNDDLSDSMIVYFSGHTAMYTDSNGNECRCLITNGKKLEKIRLETKWPIVLYGNTIRGKEGNHEYRFETQFNNSTGKSPIGLFHNFLIPNSMRFIDDTIRKYYGI